MEGPPRNVSVPGGGNRFVLGFLLDDPRLAWGKAEECGLLRVGRILILESY